MLRTTIIQYRQGHNICMTLYHIVPVVPFCILFLFWNLIILISTLFAFTTAIKRHTFYVPFSASARFGTHTLWTFAWRGQVIGPARYRQ